MDAAANSEGEGVASLFIDVGLDDSNLPAELARVKQTLVAAAKTLSASIKPTIKTSQQSLWGADPDQPQRWGKEFLNSSFQKPSSFLKARQAMFPGMGDYQAPGADVGAGRNAPFEFIRPEHHSFDKELKVRTKSEQEEREKNLEIERKIGMKVEKEMAAEAKKAAKEIQRGRERERREGLRVEAQMAAEATKLLKKEDQERLKSAHTVARAKYIQEQRAAAEVRKAWKAQAEQSAADAAKSAAQWKAAGKYIKGDFSMVGRSLFSDLSGGVGMAAKIVGGIGKVLLAPWTILLGVVKALVPLLIGAGVATVGLGIGAVKAAATDEYQTARIRAMVGKTETKRIAAEARKIALSSTFNDNDAAMGLALASNQGVRGSQVGMGLANMAAVTGGSMTSSAQMLASGRSQMLRRYGIQSSTGQKQEVKFSMPDGSQVKLVAKTMSDHMMNVIKAINIKFGTAAMEATKTLSGIFARVKNGIALALQDLGQGLLPSVKYVGTVIVNKLNSWIASGKILDLGKTVGAWLEDAIVELGGWLLTLPSMWDDIKTAFKEAPDRLKKALMDSLEIGGGLLADLFVLGIRSTGGFWMAVGEVISSKFKAGFINLMSEMQHLLPGIGKLVGQKFEEKRQEQVKVGASIITKEFQEGIGAVGAKAAWAAIQKKYDFLGGIGSDEIGNLANGRGAYGQKVTEGKTVLGLGLQGVATNVPLTDILKKFAAGQTSLGQEGVELIKQAGIEIGKRWSEGTGVNTANYAEEQKINAAAVRAGIEAVKKDTGLGKTETEDGDGPALARGSKTVSFTDFLRTAQDAVFENKMLDYAKQTAKNTNEMADKLGGGGELVMAT